MACSCFLEIKFQYTVKAALSVKETIQEQKFQYNVKNLTIYISPQNVTTCLTACRCFLEIKFQYTVKAALSVKETIQEQKFE